MEGKNQFKKSENSKTQAAANAGAGFVGDFTKEDTFIDNRPEAIAHSKLQAGIRNSPQAKQLKAFHDQANSGNKPIIASTKGLMAKGGQQAMGVGLLQLQTAGAVIQRDGDKEEEKEKFSNIRAACLKLQKVESDTAVYDYLESIARKAYIYWLKLDTLDDAATDLADQVRTIVAEFTKWIKTSMYDSGGNEAWGVFLKLFKAQKEKEAKIAAAEAAEAAREAARVAARQAKRARQNELRAANNQLVQGIKKQIVAARKVPGQEYYNAGHNPNLQTMGGNGEHYPAYGPLVLDKGNEADGFRVNQVVTGIVNSDSARLSIHFAHANGTIIIHVE